MFNIFVTQSIYTYTCILSGGKESLLEINNFKVISTLNSIVTYDVKN